MPRSIPKRPTLAEIAFRRVLYYGSATACITLGEEGAGGGPGSIASLSDDALDNTQTRKTRSPDDNSS